MRRPSPAMLVALTALVVAMSGTAVAATGGTLILGKSNKATSVTSLSNGKGTALALSSGDGKPALTVSSTDQIPKLNASLLGGKPASDYVTGDGQVSHTTDNIPYDNTVTLNLPTALSSEYYLTLACSGSGTATLSIESTTGGLQIWFADANGDNYVNFVGNQILAFPAVSPSSPDTVTLQVAFLSFVVTTFVSVAVNSASETCNYAAQSISDG